MFTEAGAVWRRAEWRIEAGERLRVRGNAEWELRELDNTVQPEVESVPKFRTITKSNSRRDS